ncbi:TPA: hypothetical protein N0F65_005421 [Lagenidium giganteum]|uniref:Uncharacterized protein n=1 Tax=Lagenidium giganteum TaxID=4803 RepID=A0AAV2Z1F0_9STRA|nr:TPA: hypothetical protein N0F65_005421 [Lagenidium giganteum]
MLGQLKYVVAKSKEQLTTLSSAGTGTPPATVTSDASRRGSFAAGKNEGEAFLRAQAAELDQVLARHSQLVASGEELSDALQSARKRLLDQVESEQYLTQNFHHVTRVREKISIIRALIEKIAEDVEDVEHFLMQQTEEYMAAQNASFAARQQQELEKFEERILSEKEERTKQLLEARRAQLEQAFHHDLKTYRTIVNYQGTTAADRSAAARVPALQETLESIDLIVTADETQLEAFYDSEPEATTERRESQFAVPTTEPSAQTSTRCDAVDNEDDEDNTATPADGMPKEETIEGGPAWKHDQNAGRATMDAKHSAPVSDAELCKGSKGLKATKAREHSDSLEYDPQVADKLAALYTKHDGDIKAIFEDLDENPKKALKYPPSSSKEFGRKYAQGFYTYAEEK